jgi:molybdopterin-guanine dinucleotide biosynthesis protein
LAIVVIGGHSRSIGKTSAVAGIIARLPEFHWTAFKITQYGHGFCTADGSPCDCQPAENDSAAHSIAVSAERDPSSGTDSARYLAAGAVRSLWVRTRQGSLADAMPRIRKELAQSENAIIESNSILRFLEPDLYLTVLDPGTADFKDSARLFLDRADAILIRQDNQRLAPHWRDVSLKTIAGIPQLPIAPPDYVTDDVTNFVRRRLAPAGAVLPAPTAP